MEGGWRRQGGREEEKNINYHKGWFKAAPGFYF